MPTQTLQTHGQEVYTASEVDTLLQQSGGSGGDIFVPPEGAPNEFNIVSLHNHNSYIGGLNTFLDEVDASLTTIENLIS